MSRETALSAPPVGAGRFAHWTYPARGGFFANLNAGAGTNGSNRGGAVDFSAASVVGGGASGTIQTFVYSPNGKAGVPCLKFNNAVAGDLCLINFGGVTTLLEKGTNPAFGGDPDKKVFSFRALLAFQPLVGALGAADLGLQINPGNVQSMMNANRPGIMLGPVDAGNIALRARWQFVAPLTVNQVIPFATAGIADISGWNLYELRFVGATGSTAGVLKAYVNGKQVGQSVTFGSDGGGPGVPLLPNFDASGGGFLGLTSRVGMNNVVGQGGGAGPYSMYLFNMAEVHASSEQML